MVVGRRGNGGQYAVWVSVYQYDDSTTNQARVLKLGTQGERQPVLFQSRKDRNRASRVERVSTSVLVRKLSGRRSAWRTSTFYYWLIRLKARAINLAGHAARDDDVFMSL